MGELHLEVYVERIRREYKVSTRLTLSLSLSLSLSVNVNVMMNMSRM